MQFEMERNKQTYTGDIYKGWFIPPHTGRYRFRMACTNQCKLWMGKTPGSNLTTDVQQLMHVSWWAYRREYWKKDANYEQRQSEWTEILEAGKEYYIEAHSVAWSVGLKSFSVAVEIEQTEIKQH